MLEVCGLCSVWCKLNFEVVLMVMLMWMVVSGMGMMLILELVLFEENCDGCLWIVFFVVFVLLCDLVVVWWVKVEVGMDVWVLVGVICGFVFVLGV